MGQKARPRFEMPNLSDRENTSQGDLSDTDLTYSSRMTANSHKEPMKATMQRRLPSCSRAEDLSSHVLYKVPVGPFLSTESAEHALSVRKAKP